MKNVVCVVVALCSAACASAGAADVDSSELEVAGQSQAISSTVDLFEEGCVDFDEDEWEVCRYTIRNVRVNGPTTLGVGVKYSATAEHWFNGEVTAKGQVRCYNPDSGDWYHEGFNVRTLVLPVQADGYLKQYIMTCREGYKPEHMPTEFFFQTVVVTTD